MADSLIQRAMDRRYKDAIFVLSQPTLCDFLICKAMLCHWQASVKPLNSAITTEKTHDPFLSPWLN